MCISHDTMNELIKRGNKKADVKKIIALFYFAITLRNLGGEGGGDSVEMKLPAAIMHRHLRIYQLVGYQD